jgi:MFS family permease
MRLVIEYIQQFKHFQRNARLFLISNVLSGITAGILLVLYNLYLISLGYHADFVGIVLFVGTIGAGLTIFPAGVCIDRFSGKIILIFSSLLIGAAGAGQILFRQPLPLLISSFVVGVGLAFLLVVTAPFLTLNSTPEERPHLFSMNISLSLITLVLGEVIGGVLPFWFRSIPWLMAPLPSWTSSLLATRFDARSYQLALLFAGVIAIPSFIPLFMMNNIRPNRRIKHSSSLPSSPDNIISQTSVSSIDIPLEPASARWLPWAAREEAFFSHTISLINIFLHSAFFFLVLVYVFTGFGAGLFIPYFNIYFVQHLNASPALFGVIDGGANAITALLTLTAPRLAKGVGKINAITLTRLASIPLLLTIGLTSILPLAAFIYLFRQGTMDMSAGILQVFSMESVTDKHRGVANSSYQAAYQVPWAAAAPIGGLIIVHFGYTPIFLLGAFFYILTIIILWVRFGSRKRAGSDEATQTQAVPF